MTRRLRAATALVIAMLGMTAALGASAAVRSIATLSSRPDRVSGGDVLVEVRQDDDAAVPVTLNGADVTAAFQPGPHHTRIGLVGGLKLGPNILAAGGARLVVHNYPIAGPIISGPHEAPFICTTASFKLYAALGGQAVASDETFGPSEGPDCFAKTKVTYLYLPQGAAVLVPLPDPSHLPTDIAITTTTTGQRVPFAVRVETAVIDRGIYQSTVLFDPTTEAQPTWRAPPRGWNRRLIAVQGAGCTGGWYFQGTSGGSAPRAVGGIEASLYSVKRLGEGYALYGNTLQNASQNCNAVLETEAAMMGKEHFTKEFGVPAYTVSVGCSGGSYGSAQPADALRGLYDAILIACTFPDPLAIASSGLDAHLLAHYFDVTAPGAFTEAQQVVISGYKGRKAFIDAANQAGRADPVPGRADESGYKSAVWSDVVPVALRYDPKSNPKGARPTIFDHARNIFGVDPATGFARRTFDNVGVQYGLAALNAGEITARQFLDLNEGVGGVDADANYVAARSAGDAAAIHRGYQSGLEVSGAGGIASIPVLDISGIYNEDGGYHYQWFHFALRERMAASIGDAKNHVMWRGSPVPFDKAWTTFIAWIEAVKADQGPGMARAKAIADKPAAAVDGCWTSPTDFVAEPQTFSREPTTTCNARFPSYGFPRLVAGGPLAADVLKCQLKAPAPQDYAVRFTPAEWARLRRIFAAGVCDWSKAGVAQTRIFPSASFGPDPENLVFDITRPG